MRLIWLLLMLWFGILLLLAAPALADGGQWTLYGALGGGAVIGDRSIPPSNPSAAFALLPHPGHGSDTELHTNGQGAIVGNLTLVWNRWDWLALELYGDSGYVALSEPGTTGDYWNRLGLGARLENRRARLRPFASFRLVHIHLAPWEIWRDHPAAAWAGSSDVGLQHRSGMSAALGVSLPAPLLPNHLRMMTAVELMYVPVGDGPQLFPLGSLGLGWTF